jgi:4-hydroxythreonine-4-phosphate dehydrogenase
MTRAARHSNKIAVTLGDPSGIGPEIIANSLNKLDEAMARRVVVFGDRGVLKGGIPAAIDLREVTRLAEADARPGAPNAAGAAAQVAYLEAAVAAAIAGDVGAIVTAPISKTQVRRAGFAFDGHTEFLATTLGAARHAMMFAGPKLKVVLATVHVPLRDVPGRITAARIVDCVELAAESMARDFGIAAPRVGVVGLNPHAGEAGLFGREEIDTLAPAIETCRAAGIDVRGPLIPDAAFRDAVAGACDVLIALYHDQALIPVKLVDFEEAVNVTLGLPIVRTSPDHGVAYDIAGTGTARATSFFAALTRADDMLRRRSG